MSTMTIGFLGCGNIGCGVYRLLKEQGEQIARNEGETFEIRRILVRSKGKKRGAEIPEALMTENPDDVLLDPQISIVMEFMGGEEPAASYMLRALEAGKTVVTANKMALATHWQELIHAARTHAAGLYYEASVCGAIPIIRAINDSLQANRIASVTGIINGTTNYILSRMTREGASYADVLADAQRLGLAEPDPTADVEGYDAVYKLSILSTLAFHRHVPVGSVYREGISGITPLDVQCGKAFGLTLKLLAIAKEVDGCVQARVHPAFVPDDHPLASVSDAFNAVYVSGHACGEMMFYGRGAGDMPTASALVSDLIKAAKTKNHQLPAVDELPAKMADDWACVHFVRMLARDEPGVLSVVSGTFARHGVSIASMVQKGETDSDGHVQLVFLTHRASERCVRQALGEMDRTLVSQVNVIRVERD
ncbi:MAG: homoserine dehydrogenase [Candidatus Ventricola sp.]|nr:homoserine dehydrogenase [Candidatus Ventricola sp.]